MEPLFNPKYSGDIFCLSAAGGREARFTIVCQSDKPCGKALNHKHCGKIFNHKPFGKHFNHNDNVVSSSHANSCERECSVIILQNESQKVLETSLTDPFLGFYRIIELRETSLRDPFFAL